MLEKTNKFLLTLIIYSPLLGIIYNLGLGLPKTIYHALIIFTFFYGILFLTLKKNIRFSNYLWPLLIYATYRLIWFFIIPIPDKRFFNLFYDATYQYSILFIIVIIQNTNFDEKFIRKIVRIIFVLIFLGVMATFIQLFYPEFLNVQVFRGRYKFIGSFYQTRRYSIFGFEDVDAIGFSFIPLTVLLLSYMLLNKHRYTRLISMFVAFIAFFSNIRFVMIGYIISLFSYFLSSKRALLGFGRVLIVSIVIVSTGYFILPMMGYSFNKFYNERLLQRGSVEQTTRIQAFTTFAIFFPKHPIFGNGEYLSDEVAKASREIAHSSRIHVGYLGQLVSYGMFGAFFLWSFWGSMAASFYKHAKKTKFWGSFLAMMIYFWSHFTLVNDSIYFAGIIFAVVFDKFYENRNQQVI